MSQFVIISKISISFVSILMRHPSCLSVFVHKLKYVHTQTWTFQHHPPFSIYKWSCHGMVSEIMVQFVNVNVFDSYLSTYLAEWAIQTKKLSPLLSIYSILKLSVLEGMDWPGIADAAHLSRIIFQVIFKSKQFHII